MAQSIGAVQLDLGVNYSQFQNQMGSIAGNAKSIVGAAFSKLGGVIAGAFAVKKLIQFGQESIDLASQLTEVQNVVDTVFGGMAGEINEFAKNAVESFGISELTAKKATSTFGAMYKSMGIGGEQMKEMAKGITALAADMTSFYDVPINDMLVKLRAGIAGEIEPLRQLGINMTIANLEAYAMSQGIRKSYQDMSQAEQAMLRYNYLLSVTSDAQGDFARTSGSWANQVRILGEQWNAFKSTMGEAFIAVLTPVVQGLNWLIGKLQIAAAYFRAFVNLITGQKNAASGAAGAVSSLAGANNALGASAGGASDALKKSGGAAKKAAKDIKGALMGFDELNVLQEKSNSGGGGSSDIGGGADFGSVGEIATPEIDTSSIDNIQIAVERALNNIRTAWMPIKDALKGPIDTAIALIVPEIDTFKSTLSTIFSDVETLGQPLSDWFNNYYLPYLQETVTTMGTVVWGLFNSFNMVFSDIWNLAVFPILNNFITVGLPLITSFYTEAMITFNTFFLEVKQIFDLLWSEGVAPALQLISTMWTEMINGLSEAWQKWGEPIFAGIRTALQNTGDFLRNVWETILKPVWDNFMETVDRLWSNHLKPLLDNFWDLIGEFINGATQIYNEFISPLINAFVEQFGPLISGVFETVTNIVGDTVGRMMDIINGIISVVKGVIQFLVGAFTFDWEKSWEGIKNIFSGVWDAITGILKGSINVIVDLLNGLLSLIEGACNALNNGINRLTGAFGVPAIPTLSIPRIPKLARGGIVDQPTLAMVGEAGKEAVVPLENNTGWMNKLSEAVANAMIAAAPFTGAQQGGGDIGDIVLNLDGRTFARIVKPYLDRENKRVGDPVVIITG